MNRKRLVILGSTGSIGLSALRVVEALADRFQVIGLATRRNADLVLAQAAACGAARVAVADEDAAAAARAAAPAGVTVLAGAGGLEELAAWEEADLVLAATVGLSGLRPVLAAVRAGTDVALATKEVLVAAGHLVTRACAESGARLLPVDSEHSAVFQCLAGRPAAGVRRIILTASGGPFVHKPDLDFDKVTVAEALRHPRWNMGRKVTVDSATMMNKGLELIEAHWLFGVPFEKLEVLVHPESIVHSLVAFADGCVLAQLSPSDMRYAIQHALTFPDRVDGGLPPLDLAGLGRLHFEQPNEARFPCLGLARAAACAGGTLPVALNAANEVAVERFLAGGLAFSGIWRTVEKVLERQAPQPDPDWNLVLETDARARRDAAHIIEQMARR
jgi:1-deoxy-D-xylulose-5-phosphate reductoisomerase